MVYIIINFVQKRWAHVQSRRAYPDFLAEFDRLTPEDIVWEPYSELAITTCAPFGIPSVCFQDQAFWMTTTGLVYDVYIEAHCPDRVRRQFGQRQLYPVPSALATGRPGRDVGPLERHTYSTDHVHAQRKRGRHGRGGRGG